MSERMTSERLAAAMDALENDQQQLDEDGVFVGVSRQAIHEVLAHLRSQTPPHAVTREQIAKHLYDEEHKRCRNVWKWEDSGLDDEHPGARDRYYRYADAILALLAEKPAPTPLTLTGEDRAFLTGLISHHKERRHDVVVQTLTELRERLSASPTAPPKEETGLFDRPKPWTPESDRDLQDLMDRDMG